MKALNRFRLLSRWALLIFVAGGTYGCGDFLVANPQGTLNEETLANAAGIEGNLIATYRMLDHTFGAWGTAASNWVWGSATSDDAYKGSEASDQPPITDLEMYVWSTGGADDYLNDAWRHRYEGIVRANATIKLLDKIVEERPDEISQTNQDGIRGEATFLRAFYHFEAWRLWGNIPYYTEADTTYRKSNQGVDALALVLTDLDAAIALLPTSPRNGNVGRATRWTAKALKGKVLMYDNDYAGAIAVLEDVRSNGPYALEPNFFQVWSAFSEYENGPETILAYQASANDGNPGGDNANYGERLNFPHSGSPFGCCGFHQASQNLVNFFQVSANGLPLALTDNTWNSRNTNLDAAASATMRLDPRLDWTVGRDGVPFKDWGPHASGWIRAPAYGGPYSAKKTVYENASGAVSNVGWVPTQLSSMNIHIYRYADLLLHLAEAYVETGRLDDARTIVNQIRTRAGVVAQGQGTDRSSITVPINDPSITWADYEIGQYPAAGWTQDYARTAVRYERRLELAMEGERFFDLRRWGIAESVLNAYMDVEKTRRPYLVASQVFSARHALFPLPTVQIELSEVEGQQTLVQNSGW